MGRIGFIGIIGELWGWWIEGWIMKRVIGREKRRVEGMEKKRVLRSKKCRCGSLVRKSMG